MRRIWIPALIFALASASLAACGGSGAPAAKKASGFPVAVASGDGTVRISHRPTRILSLSPSSTQMLYAIGAGSQVVGVDKYSTFPPDAPRTKFTGYETSAEDYVGLRPDLVILAYDSNNLVSQLAKLGIPTLLIPPATTIPGANHQLVELGQATGHAKGAANAINVVEQDLRRVAATIGERARGESYYVELDPTLYTATSATFIGALFSIFHMVDIANPAGRHGSAYPQISSEFLLRQNPDYVFLADTVCCAQTATTFSHRSGFSVLRAVRLGHVFGVNDSVASEWGPHSLEQFLADVARALTVRR
jgi:iron complex transport system substrate-binding protein